jgi:hypothetical protein
MKWGNVGEVLFRIALRFIARLGGLETRKDLSERGARRGRNHIVDCYGNGSQPTKIRPVRPSFGFDEV